MTRFLAACALSLGFACSTAYAADGAADAPKRLTAEQWCETHDVPKDKCWTCDPKLVPAFKKDKDWCKEHAKPESFCVECDPKVKDKLDALRPEATKPAGK